MFAMVGFLLTVSQLFLRVRYRASMVIKLRRVLFMRNARFRSKQEAVGFADIIPDHAGLAH